jgi:hypothetical protein
MNNSPDNLEKFIHETLRALPDRRAPRSLESRVMAAIEARAARPWWKQSFGQWPVAARIAFAVMSVGLVRLALMLTVWAVGGFQESELAQAFTAQLAWIDAIRGGLRGIAESLSIIVRSIPSMWLYGTLACIGALYATLFSLGATAYRALTHR